MNNNIVNIFKLLFIIHILVDFYGQTDASTELKENQKFTWKKLCKNELLKHTLIYCILSSTIFILYFSSSPLDYFVVILLFISHGAIDWFKIILTKSLTKDKKHWQMGKTVLFIGDQIIHITIMLSISNLIFNSFNYRYIGYIDIKYINYLLAILLLYKPSNVIFKKIFGGFNPDRKIESLDCQSAKKKSAENKDVELKDSVKTKALSVELKNQPNISNYGYIDKICIDNGDLELGKTAHGCRNAGAIIGGMERFLIAICLLTGNFVSIGIVIAAKSVARFKYISKQEYAEYFLIGTFYSLLFTMVVYYLAFKL